MLQGDGVPSTSLLNFEARRALLRKICGRYAAHLLHRRALLGTGQPLSEIAYVCGFRDYTHFARKFRRRFGHPPGAHGQGIGDGTVRADTGNGTSWAHDIQPLAN